MKTQIITLESHDDLISVRDRMSWAKTPRILLVWPKYEKVTLRQVDLKVLQRHAVSLGAQLGLVTRRRRVRVDAEALRIPVFDSTGQAQRVAWPKPRRRRWPLRPPRRDLLREKREQASAAREVGLWHVHPVVRVGAFLLGVVSVLVLVALFIPRAEVRLQPRVQTQSITLPVAANPSIESVFITGSIPARETRVILSGTETVAVTGEGVIPQSKARGLVVFRNLTQQAVSIPAGTVVRTADEGAIRFVTTRSGEVPAGVGETLELRVEAVDAGLAGNVEAESIVVVEDRLGLSLAATNPEPLTGGREVPSVQATERDRQRAKDRLMRDLESQARLQLADEIGAGDILFEDTVEVAQTLSEIYDPPPGAASTRLTLSMQVEFSAQYASAADLTRLASLALNASIPPGFFASEQAMSLQPITQPNRNDDGNTRWTVRAERLIVQQIHHAQVMQMIQGIASPDARARLEQSLPLAAAPEIRLSPPWWPWVPIVPFRISVVTE
ncbi:MAG TPA: baseplate J/gp47 family protein [Anaerolineales bacterium]|nr:baseplate J/gp47 family protein [Anaerolineales bacterium]